MLQHRKEEEYSLIYLLYTLSLFLPLCCFIHTDVIPNTTPILLYYHPILNFLTTYSNGTTWIYRISHGRPPSVVYNIICHKSNMILIIAHSTTVFCLPEMYVSIICRSIYLSMSNLYGYTHIPLSDIWGIIYAITMANPTFSTYRCMHMVAASTHVYYPYSSKYCTADW